MKKILFGIFAHPDDESFGPSGTLLKMARDNVDIHMICTTDGSAGVNSDERDNLGEVRIAEWQKAGDMIGVTSMHHLGYPDGGLCNSHFHQIADQIEEQLNEIVGQYENQEVEISFMTFDQNGISGHLDHILMSFVTSYVFYRFKNNHPDTVHVKDLYYFCISKKDQPVANTDFVFMPPGRSDDEIDIKNDISDVAEEKRAIMLTHHSQRHDAQALINLGFVLETEYFYLYT